MRACNERGFRDSARHALRNRAALTRSMRSRLPLAWDLTTSEFFEPGCAPDAEVRRCDAELALALRAKQHGRKGRHLASRTIMRGAWPVHARARSLRPRDPSFIPSPPRTAWAVMTSICVSPSRAATWLAVCRHRAATAGRPSKLLLDSDMRRCCHACACAKSPACCRSRDPSRRSTTRTASRAFIELPCFTTSVPNSSTCA